MSLHTQFYNFVLASDMVAQGNGASSVAQVGDSDFGSLLASVSTNKAYHITGLDIMLETLSDNIKARFVTLDSDGAAGAATSFTPDFVVANGAALGADASKHLEFNPPLKVTFSSNANFMGVRMLTNDSDAAAGVGYSGFWTRET